MTDDDIIMEFTTGNVTQFRTVFETIRSVRQEINLDCSPSGGGEEAGMHIRALTRDLTIMVDAFFPERDLVEKGSYSCRRKCCAGLNLAVLCHILKSLRHDDTLTLRLRDGSDYMYLSTVSADGLWRGEFVIPLLDLDTIDPSLDVDIPGSTITMSAESFQSMMSKIACTNLTVVLLRIRDGQFTVASDDGTTATGSYSVKYADVFKDPAERQQQQQPAAAASNARGRFDYKQLLKFTKIAPICPDVCIHLGSGQAIILDYRIVSVGTVRFIMAAKEADEGEDGEEEKEARSRKRMRAANE